jgi:peptidyl-prolyl cis-trans isomerase SurA
MNKKKMLAALTLVGSLSMATACGAGANQAAESTPAQQSSQSGQGQAAAPSPDLTGVPDVVATVNGKDIGKDEFSRVYESQFQQSAMQAQMSGQELDQNELKKSAAESMVGTELLMQHADRANIQATDDQIAKTLSAAAKSNDMSNKEFLAALEKQGVDRKQVDVQLTQQVEVEAVIKKELGTFSASEKELKAAYDQAKAQQEQQAPAQSGDAAKMPSYKEVRPQLKQQVVQQKEGAATQKLVEKLRAEGDVKVNI